MATNLMLHVGSEGATIKDVRKVKTPAATDTWRPIPHAVLYDTVRQQIEDLGLKIDREQHGLWRENNARYFGVLDIVDPQEADSDHGLVVGLRNSHDQRFPAGIACGSRVFVCDNLAFSGEIVVARKHTMRIMDDLERLVNDAFGKLGEAREIQETRITAYKEHEFTDIQVHDLVIKSLDAQVVPVTRIPAVLSQWRESEHEEFEPRTGWSLFNAYTEAMKGLNINEFSKRTLRLHGLLDTACGLLLPSLN